jgi:hypothetical protein
MAKSKQANRKATLSNFAAVNERPTDFRTLRVRSEVDGCELPMRFARRTKDIKVGRVIAITTPML